MPQSIPKGLTREHVLKALADLDAGIDHPFGKPTGYELVRRRFPAAARGHIHVFRTSRKSYSYTSIPICLAAASNGEPPRSRQMMP